jgi:hypothetical protein
MQTIPVQTIPAQSMPSPATLAQAASADTHQPTSPYDHLALPPPPPSLEARLAEAAKIADPNLRQAVTANLHLQTQRDIQAHLDQQRDVKGQAKAIIDQGGDLAALPAKLLLQIDPAGRRALTDYATAHGNPQTDPAAYYQLKNQALDDPAGFQGVDLHNHMARLSTKDFADLSHLQNSLRQGQPPADLPLQRAYKGNTDRMLQQLGLPVAEAGDATAYRQAIDLRQDVDQRLAAHQVATGRPANPQEHQQLLDQAVIDRASQQRPAMAATTKALAAIPTIHQAAIIAQFQAQGIHPTAGQILRAYQHLQAPSNQEAR